MENADSGLAYAVAPAASDSSPCWCEEEFVVVGYQRVLDMPYRLILAREVEWDLELATTATVQLPERDQRKLKARLEQFRTDYPHLEVGKQKGEWVRPLIRVRARYRDDGDGPRSASITALEA